MKEYTVNIDCWGVRSYAVEANSPEEALELVKKEDSSATFCEFYDAGINALNGTTTIIDEDEGTETEFKNKDHFK